MSDYFEIFCNFPVVKFWFVWSKYSVCIVDPLFQKYNGNFCILISEFLNYSLFLIGRLYFFEWKYFIVIRRAFFSGNILLSLNVASFGFVIILHQWYRECWYLIFPFVPFVHFIFDCDGYSSSTETFPSNIFLCFQDSV